MEVEWRRRVNASSAPAPPAIWSHHISLRYSNLPEAPTGGLPTRKIELSPLSPTTLQYSIERRKHEAFSFQIRIFFLPLSILHQLTPIKVCTVRFRVNLMRSDPNRKLIACKLNKLWKEITSTRERHSSNIKVHSNPVYLRTWEFRDYGNHGTV